MSPKSEPWIVRRVGKEYVVYNGVRMVAGWPAKIVAAQSLTEYTISGKKLARIRFGDDDPRWGNRPCLDCGVRKGQLHVPHCEYEKCPACGGGGCNCVTEELREPDEELSPAENEGMERRNRNLNRVTWVFVVIALLVLIRSILILFGI